MMAATRLSCRLFPCSWRWLCIVFFLIVSYHREVLTKKAVIEWSPDGKPFRDPLINHAALVELHLYDRIVFVCNDDVPTVIFKMSVSEGSFAKCTHDLSAQWIGECSAGTSYVTVSLRPFGVIHTQSIYNQNATYFFTSFSSSTKYEFGSRTRNLCQAGVRLILEVHAMNVDVPSLRRSATAGSQKEQVPVQRVSYGLSPEQIYRQSVLESNLVFATSTVISTIQFDELIFSHENMHINDNDELKWNFLPLEYLNYSCNTMNAISALVIIPVVTSVVTGI